HRRLLGDPHLCRPFSEPGNPLADGADGASRAFPLAAVSVRGIVSAGQTVPGGSAASAGAQSDLPRGLKVEGGVSPARFGSRFARLFDSRCLPPYTPSISPANPPPPGRSCLMRRFAVLSLCFLALFSAFSR